MASGAIPGVLSDASSNPAWRSRQPTIRPVHRRVSLWRRGGSPFAVQGRCQPSEDLVCSQSRRRRRPRGPSARPALGLSITEARGEERASLHLTARFPICKGTSAGGEPARASDDAVQRDDLDTVTPRRAWGPPSPPPGFCPSRYGWRLRPQDDRVSSRLGELRAESLVPALAAGQLSQAMRASWAPARILSWVRKGRRICQQNFPDIPSPLRRHHTATCRRLGSRCALRAPARQRSIALARRRIPSSMTSGGFMAKFSRR
jgi:hypothetical protein